MHPRRGARLRPLDWSVRAVVLFLVFIAQLLSLCRHVEGSHYIRYQMSDYCDPLHMPAPIELKPNGNMSAIFIKLKREMYRGSMDCTITVRAPPNYGLMAFITKLKMRRITATRADKIEFTSNNVTLLRMHGLNQEVMPRKTILTGPETNQLEVRFVSDSSSKTLAGKGFKVVVNLYSNALSENECDSKLNLDFNCGNDICIDSFLECDGTNNCRNNEDELECDETSETKLSLYVFLVTIAVMVVLVMMFMMKNKEKRKEIVRRMSRVYAQNNPILYVMETDTDSQTNDSATSLADSRLSSPPPPTTSSQRREVTFQDAQHLPRLGSVRSKLSLSLPQGIDQIVGSHKATNNHV